MEHPFEPLRDAVTTLNDALRDVITEFEARTGCRVDSVEINRVDVGRRHPLLSSVEAEVRL